MKIGFCGNHSKWENCEAGKLDPQNIEITPPADELEMLIGRMDYYRFFDQKASGLQPGDEWSTVPCF